MFGNMQFSRLYASSEVFKRDLIQLSTPKFGKFLRVAQNGYLEETGFRGKLFEELKGLFKFANACDRTCVGYSLKKLVKPACKAGWVKAAQVKRIIQIAARAGLIGQSNSQKNDSAIARLIDKISAQVTPSLKPPLQNLPGLEDAKGAPAPQSSGGHRSEDVSATSLADSRAVVLMQLPAEIAENNRVEDFQHAPKPLSAPAEDAGLDQPLSPAAPVVQTSSNSAYVASLVKSVAIPLLLVGAGALCAYYFSAAGAPAQELATNETSPSGIGGLNQSSERVLPKELPAAEYALVSLIKRASGASAGVTLTEEGSKAQSSEPQPEFKYLKSPHYVLNADFAQHHTEIMGTKPGDFSANGFRDDAHCVLFGDHADERGFMTVPSMEAQKQILRTLKFTYHPDKRAAHPDACKSDGCKLAYSNIETAMQVTKDLTLEPGMRVYCGLPPGSSVDARVSASADQALSLHPTAFKSDFSQEYTGFKRRYQKFADKQLAQPRTKEKFQEFVSGHRSVRIGHELDEWNDNMQFFDPRSMGPRMEKELIKRAYCLLYSDQHKSRVEVPAEAEQLELQNQLLDGVVNKCQQAALSVAQCRGVLNNIENAVDLTATFKIEPGTLLNCGQKASPSWINRIFG